VGAQEVGKLSLAYDQEISRPLGFYQRTVKTITSIPMRMSNPITNVFMLNLFIMINICFQVLLQAANI